MLMMQQKNWSGMLPEPDIFQQYPANVQERIMRWNDSWTVDESARQDKLVDTEVKTALRGQGWAVFLFLILSAMGFVLFLLGNNVGGSVMLGVPAVTVILALIRGRATRTQIPPNDDDSS